MQYEEYLTKRRPYQEAGMLLLLERKHACLFFVPGKGKTYPCIDAIRDIDKSKNGRANVLVLSTADAIRNMWEVDIVPQNIMPKNTVYMSFNSAIQEKTKAKLLATKWDIIVCDESHKIKANTSKTSKLVYMLSRKTEYVFGLTGTPRGNSDLDIFCQFHNMCVSDWGKVTYSFFVDNCCDVEKKFFAGNCIRIPTGINAKYKAGWERNIALYSMRVDYDEDDAMPDLDVNVINLPFEPTDEYKKAEEGVIAIQDYESTMTKLAAITKMHQAANGFLYLTDDIEEKRITHTFKHNDKLDWLQQNVGYNEKVVIVYRFEADKNEIEKLFDSNKIAGTIEEFKNTNKNILLLQCSRCESFNLQDVCNRIIFYTLDYSFIKYDQMLHRVWRKGQDKPVVIQILLFEGSIETTIWNTVKTKKQLSDLFMSIKGEV